MRLDKNTVKNCKPLIITGSALTKNLIITPSDWHLDNPDMREIHYSSNNHFNFFKIWRMKGFDFSQLLNKAGFHERPDTPVTFMADDGFSYTENLACLMNRYFYPDLTIEQRESVPPMIVVYRVLCFDEKDPQLPISWKTQKLTKADLDPQSPRLVIGQRLDNAGDDNQSVFVGNLIKIVVGEA